MVLSKNMDLETKIQTINAGCDDYVEIPVPITELAARMKALVRKKMTADALNSIVERAMHSSITDTLTGVYNYSYFRHYLDMEIKRCIRQGYSLTLLLIEINNFGRYTEDHGITAAEAVIGKTAEIITSVIRAVDFPARFSFQKFAVILPQTEGHNGSLVLERITGRIIDYFNSSSHFPKIQGIGTGLSVAPAEGIDCSSVINAANSRLLKS
jgi:diguanylate cyclase (GGDEF)-like protein